MKSTLLSLVIGTVILCVLSLTVVHYAANASVYLKLTALSKSKLPPVPKSSECVIAYESSHDDRIVRMCYNDLHICYRIWSDIFCLKRIGKLPSDEMMCDQTHYDPEYDEVMYICYNDKHICYEPWSSIFCFDR